MRGGRSGACGASLPRARRGPGARGRRRRDGDRRGRASRRPVGGHRRRERRGSRVRAIPGPADAAPARDAAGQHLHQHVRRTRHDARGCRSRGRRSIRGDSCDGWIKQIQQRAAQDDEDFEAQPMERALLDLVAGPSTAAPQPRRVQRVAPAKASARAAARESSSGKARAIASISRRLKRRAWSACVANSRALTCPRRAC